MLQPCKRASSLQLPWNKTGCCLDSGKSLFSYLHSLESSKWGGGGEGKKKINVQRPQHIADSVTLTFILWPVVNCPDSCISISWCTERLVGTRSKHESCLCEKKAVLAPEKCNYPTSLRSRRIRWRPAVTDGHLWRGSNRDAYHADKGVNATLITNICVL